MAATDQPQPTVQAALAAVDGADWLAGIAVASSVTPDLLELVAIAKQAPPPAEGWDALHARLVAAGALRPSDGTWQVHPGLRQALLQQLRSAGEEPAELRRRLLSLGLAADRPRLADQLALWARQARDWRALRDLWLNRPACFWLRGEPEEAAFVDLPLAARREYAGLGQAMALRASLGDSGCDRTVLLQLLTREVQLHSAWAGVPDPDAQVRAGTLWLLAQQTLHSPGSAAALEAAKHTEEAITAAIARAVRAGRPPRPTTQTFFHAIAGAQALLRGEFEDAGEHSELALVLAGRGDQSALVAAAHLEVMAVWLGDLARLQRAQAWFSAHEAECGATAGIALPIHRLAQAVAAMERLDGAAAAAELSQLSPGQRGHDLWSLQLITRAVYDLLWVGPQQALAELDAAATGVGIPTEGASLETVLLTRTRAELLLALGRNNEAESVLQAAGEVGMNHLVTWARLYLCAGDWNRAVAKASLGLYSTAVSLPDRAHLHLLRAAALLGGGADATEVAQAVSAACGVGVASGCLIPIAMLSAELREALLAVNHHDGGPCPLREAIDHSGMVAAGQYQGSARLISLTPRERQLLPLLAGPETFEQLAARLHVSANTIRNQVVTLRGKLGAANRAELVARANEAGLLRDRPEERGPGARGRT